jgi:putative heme-binding domain-containing protein
MMELTYRMFRTAYCIAFISVLSIQAGGDRNQVFGQLAESVLQSRSVAQWAKEARDTGDAKRGAILFYQGALACARCHLPDSSGKPSLGPNLGHVGQIESAMQLSDAQVVESVLSPSATIRKGYETSVFKLDDGTVQSGLLVDRSGESIELRDANGERVVIAPEDVEEEVKSTQSMMPAGLVSQLANEQALLDLFRYLFEVQAGGPKVAATLQPDLSLLAIKVPQYEARIDHAGFIRGWNQDSFARGQAIYTRVCANCHGTKELMGSLPTALRFGEGKFKRGSDPYTMYQTLTHGYGYMPAQTWMVPSQKYDVIHYIRDTFFGSNPNISVESFGENYFAGLPKGDSRGPEPSNIEAWSAMDYGNMLTHCYEIPGERLNIAYKGVAIRLDPGPGGIARGGQWMVFDTDTLRWAAAWELAEDKAVARFIDWRDIQFNGEHGIHPRISGSVVFANSTGPGWRAPEGLLGQGEDVDHFQDTLRVEGRDQRRYGPLPREWGQYQGQFVVGSQTVLAYQVGKTQILEAPRSTSTQDGKAWFGRILNVAAHEEGLELRVADCDKGGDEQFVPLRPAGGSDIQTATALVGRFGDRMIVVAGMHQGLSCQVERDRVTLRVAPQIEPRQFSVWVGKWSDRLGLLASHSKEMGDWLSPFVAEDHDLMPGPNRWKQRWPDLFETQAVAVGAQSSGGNAFAVDAIQWPDSNPWLAQMRFTGLDFYSDGSMAVCSWDGDVWHVREDMQKERWTWKRMVSGLYQPLGLKIIDDQVYVTCRDQLAALHDLNGDDETDFIECFNNDHQVTEHFHEFAMGLQADAEGNFYYAKSGRHALAAVVPQHGTLLKVSADGKSTEILATGFRAANGVCLNKDGSFIVTDQEGFWNPKNRINWVTVDPSGKPKFYGNMFGYHDVTDTSDEAMEPPLCWITNAFDRSPAELLWVDSPTWGELQGGLLNLSYGYGKVYLVLHEEVDGLRQGGMIELPIPAFPTGVMRGRFSPGDHHLYLCGMFSWAGNATAPGGLYRIRKLPEVSSLPISLRVEGGEISLGFAQPLAENSADVSRVQIRRWGLKRSRNYGSEHINERPMKIVSSELSSDRRTMVLQVEDLEPTWGMEIRYRWEGANGQPIEGVIHNTIHRTGKTEE